MKLKKFNKGAPNGEPPPNYANPQKPFLKGPFLKKKKKFKNSRGLKAPGEKNLGGKKRNSIRGGKKRLCGF